jgi:hypothetical protein
MMHPTKEKVSVLFDACVLANFAVCDLFLRLSESPAIIEPLWTGEILQEVYNTHTSKLNWNRRIADSFQVELIRHFPEAFVKQYESVNVPFKVNSKDLHVAKAAIKSKSNFLCTFNLKDFSREGLQMFEIVLIHPDDLLIHLFPHNKQKVTSCLNAIAVKRQCDIVRLMEVFVVSIPLFTRELLSNHA